LKKDDIKYCIVTEGADFNFPYLRVMLNSLLTHDSWVKDNIVIMTCDLTPLSPHNREILKTISDKINLPNAKVKFIVPARKFDSGNLNKQDNRFGKGIIIDGGKGHGFAEYKIYFKEYGRYELWSYYTTGELRPVEIYFDDNLITKEAMSCTTSGWKRAISRPGSEDSSTC